MVSTSPEYERLRFIPLVDPMVERGLGLLRPGRRSLSPADPAMATFVVEPLRSDALAAP